MDYQRLYEYRFRGIDQKDRQAVWNVIANHVYGLMGRPQRVIDPAAGRCEFINAIPAAERWVIDEVNYAEAYRAPEVKVLIADALKAELPAGHFDGVFASNFLEHLLSQEQVHQFLVRMRLAMREGGRIAIMGPNFRYCAAEYFDCADHTLALTHVAVAEHLYSAGFKLQRVIPRFLPYSFRGLLPPSPFLTSMYFKMPFAWRFLGKQYLVIAER
jgi:hypothetical protein